MKTTGTANGRVNLLGEHTDYSGGLVLPLPIQQQTQTTVESSSTPGLRIHSDQFPEETEFPLLENLFERFVPAKKRPIGMKIDVQSSLPIGCGLASSAAVAVSLARALNQHFDLAVTPMEIALACQSAEQEALGVPCGLMDPLVAAAGKSGHAFFLDCKTWEYQQIPMPSCLVVTIDSGIRHRLADSPYADRVRESLEAVHQKQGGVRRNKRRLHFETENRRVMEGVAALREKNLQAFGKLMLASHESLRINQEVSCYELDKIVDQTKKFALGAKLTGAGFGGAVVALPRRDSLNQMMDALYPKTAMIVCGVAS